MLIYPTNKRCELRVNSTVGAIPSTAMSCPSNFLEFLSLHIGRYFESIGRDKIFIIFAAQRTEATGHTETTEASAGIGNDESVRQNSYCTYGSL